MTMPRFHVRLQGPALAMDDPTPVGRALLVVHGLDDISIMHATASDRTPVTMISGAVQAGSLAEALWLAHKIVVTDVLAPIFDVTWAPTVAQVNAISDEATDVISAEVAEVVQMEEPEVPTND